MAESTIPAKIAVDSSELDEAIEKANRLVELLKEVDPKKPVPMTKTEMKETLVKQFRILSECSSERRWSGQELLALTQAMLKLDSRINSFLPYQLDP